MIALRLLAIAIALAGLSAAGWLWWRRTHRKSPAERERARRLAVNAAGRLAEAVVVDDPRAQIPSPNPELIFYQYRAAGMDYTAAQDVSALRHLIDPASCRPGSFAAVKYDPQRPTNSILVCEQWSGLRPQTGAKPGVPLQPEDA